MIDDLLWEQEVAYQQAAWPEDANPYKPLLTPDGDEASAYDDEIICRLEDAANIIIFGIAKDSNNNRFVYLTTPNSSDIPVVAIFKTKDEAVLKRIELIRAFNNELADFLKSDFALQ